MAFMRSAARKGFSIIIASGLRALTFAMLPLMKK
jgi:hypothetical protein